MGDPKPEGEINGTIGQGEIEASEIHSWVERSSWFPGFLRVKKCSLQEGILGLRALSAREHRLPAIFL